MYGSNVNSNSMSDYQAALTVFTDATLTQVCHSLFGGYFETDLKKDDSDNNNKISSELIAVYNNCRTACITIEKLEATDPGMLGSMSSSSKQRTQMKRGANHQAEKGTAKEKLKYKIQQPDLRRANSASSNNSSSISNSNTVAHYHHLSRHNSQTIGSTSRLLRQQQHQQQQKRTSTPPPQLSSSDSKIQTKVSSRNDKDGIPESALNFLAALNGNTTPSQNLKREENHNISKEIKLTNQSPTTYREVNAAHDDTLRTPMETKILHESNENEESLIDPPSQAPEAGTYHARTLRVNRRNLRKRKNDEHVDESASNASNDDCFTMNENLKNEVKRKRITSHRSTRKGSKKKRLLGSPDVIYNVGDEVAVYYEADGKWYEGTITDVTLQKYSCQRTKEEIKMSDGMNQYLDKRVQEASSGQCGEKHGNMENGDELNVLCYSIEYDNGEIQDGVPPEDIVDRLD
mmetsp:Transcript_19763/g.24377  ORF Transcript_19763/g.24377 Transcript_19763/m.24377 type:complete len:461 (-) Transcript_19763:170-1552(-)